MNTQWMLVVSLSCFIHYLLCVALCVLSNNIVTQETKLFSGMIFQSV